MNLSDCRSIREKLCNKHFDRIYLENVKMKSTLNYVEKMKICEDKFCNCVQRRLGSIDDLAMLPVANVI